VDKLLIIGTHGREDTERATIPFVLALTTMASGMDATLLLQVDAVNLAKKGYADDIKDPVFPPIKDLMTQFMEAGGKLMVCNPCMKARRIEPKDLLEGAIVVNAPTIVQELSEAKNVVSY
jgi:predicted peroxiredoxin